MEPRAVSVWARRLERRRELLRARMAGWSGASIGRNVGLGRRCRIEYPECLELGDDVSISDDAYMHCLSERGVRIASDSNIDPRLWLHCGGQSWSGRRDGFFEMGHHSYLGANAVVGAGGGVTIGNDVLVGQSVNFHSEQHRFRDARVPIRSQGISYEPIVIHDDVWIGSQVTILAGVTIGRGSVIGAGAVVTRSIPPGSIAVGVPAKVIGTR